jgi:hypothetical protein
MKFRIAFACIATMLFLPGQTAAADPLPDILLETHEITSDCEALETIKGAKPITAELSDVATLYALPCTKSSHDDTTYRVYLFETGEIGGIRPLLFSIFTPEFGWVGTDILRGVELDAKTASITHTTRSRWGGACGSHGKWMWNSFTLKMLEFRYRKSCKASRAVGDWVKVYPTTR